MFLTFVGRRAGLLPHLLCVAQSDESARAMERTVKAGGRLRRIKGHLSRDDATSRLRVGPPPPRRTSMSPTNHLERRVLQERSELEPGAGEEAGQQPGAVRVASKSVM